MDFCALQWKDVSQGAENGPVEPYEIHERIPRLPALLSWQLHSDAETVPIRRKGGGETQLPRRSTPQHRDYYFPWTYLFHATWKVKTYTALGVRKRRPGWRHLADQRGTRGMSCKAYRQECEHSSVRYWVRRNAGDGLFFGPKTWRATLKFFPANSKNAVFRRSLYFQHFFVGFAAL